jgi:hypothetical protein
VGVIELTSHPNKPATFGFAHVWCRAPIGAVCRSAKTPIMGERRCRYCDKKFESLEDHLDFAMAAVC